MTTYDVYRRCQLVEPASVSHLVLGCFVASLFRMGKGPAKLGQGTAPLALVILVAFGAS